MDGSIINAVAIALGGLLGLLLGGRFPERLNKTIMQGVGLAVLMVGIDMGLRTQNSVIVLLSIVIGGIIGEALQIEERFNRLSERLEAKYTKNGDGRFTKGFVTASLLYCVGPMAITGAFQNGLLGDASILITKSFLDGISAVALGAGLGYGVVFSAIPVLLYQGGLALGATWIKPLLSETVILEMTATGGVLILGIALTMLEIKRLKVANFLPALFAVVPIVYLWQPFR